jgi:hypothetical protein
MAGAKPKTFLAGAAIVWRHHRVLWLVYFANLLLALVGARGAVARTGEILNHSLTAERLVHGFNLGTYGELALHPSLPFSASRPMMLFSAILFALFMLFATGGVLAEYYEDRRLTPGNFFQACGEHFWRFLRLMIWFAFALIPVGILIRLAGGPLPESSSAIHFPLPWGAYRRSGGRNRCAADDVLAAVVRYGASDCRG